MKPTRRDFLQRAGMVTVATGVAAGDVGCASKPFQFSAGPDGNSVVSILRAASYSADLVSRMVEGAEQCGLEVRGKRVLLKPNLVEFDAATVINTNVAVLAAAVELFERLGAAEVLIGEGPGHRRDTRSLAEQADYRNGIPHFLERFVDLNLDDVSAVKNFADEIQIFLPNSALRADLVVSVAKMKTHHWAGATLSMKNFFGLVPGAVYGWPKNKLHYIGISRAIAELHRLFEPKSFAIVDGIVGMEGNGPIQGRPRQCGLLIMGSDLVAVDATCCRVMGIDPAMMEYLALASCRGHVQSKRIEQRGELVAAVRTTFAPSERFRKAVLA